MLAKGPPCTNAGVPSIVCTRLGFMASLSSTHMAPSAFISAQVTGLESYVYPTTIRPKRAFRSLSESAKHSTAITSEATVMSNPSSLGTPLVLPPSPLIMLLSWRSFMSTARLQHMRRGSMFSWFPCWMWLSTIAAKRLFAAPMAWKSPVKCRFMSSMGSSCDRPPPAAPPFTPNTGPRLGSLSAAAARFPMKLRPSASPTLVVVLPSPAAVGVLAVTSTSFPSLSVFLSSLPVSILALYLP